MAVKSIRVNGLFGMMDHSVPLFENSRITIVTGPNGVGKTSLLKLIHGALRPATHVLRTIPYDELVIEFDGDRRLVVRPQRSTEVEARHSRKPIKVEYEYSAPGVSTQRHLSSVKVSREIYMLIDRYLQDHTRIGPDEWIEDATGISRDAATLVEMHPDLGERLPDADPAWLLDLRQEHPVHLLETQRLLAMPVHRRHRHYERASSTQEAVVRCSEDMSSRIKEVLARYANVSQSLDGTFPHRVMTSEEDALKQEAELRVGLSSIDEQRTRLEKAGLLEGGEDRPLPSKEFGETTRRVLATYLSDAARKFDVFNDILARIELLKRIINRRYRYKELAVDRDAGLVVLRRDHTIPLAKLSSGEQHQLVLVYELLFKTREETLILIDEPELSLHVNWQQAFLEDLDTIAKVASLRALVATHSPNIVHNHWDFAVELAGPNE